jgi:hypothetical protein
MIRHAFDTIAVTVMMLFVAGCIAFPFLWWGGIVYVLWHFISKFW